MSISKYRLHVFSDLVTRKENIYFFFFFPLLLYWAAGVGEELKKNIVGFKKLKPSPSMLVIKA